MLGPVRGAGRRNLDVFCGEGLPVRREAEQHVARHPLVALARQQGAEERHGGQQVEPGAPDDREHQLGVEPEVRGRDTERQVALDPARVPQAKLVANERCPSRGRAGGRGRARPPARRPVYRGGIRAAARHVPGTGAARHGRSGRPDLPRWVHWLPRPAPARTTPSAMPAEGGCRLAAVMGHPRPPCPAPPSLASAAPASHGLARPVLPGRARRGSGRGRRSHEHR